MLPAGILAIIKEEWIAHHVDAREVDAIARRETRGRFFVCAIIGEGESDEPTRSVYRSLGYRLLATEGFFVQRLKRVPKPRSPVPIERVRTSELAARLANMPVRVWHLRSAAGGLDAFRGCDFALLSENDQGMPWTTGAAGSLNRFIVDRHDIFKLVGTYRLPNGDAVHLYFIDRGA